MTDWGIRPLVDETGRTYHVVPGSGFDAYSVLDDFVCIAEARPLSSAVAAASADAAAKPALGPTLTAEQVADLESIVAEFPGIWSAGSHDIGLVHPDLKCYHHVRTGDAEPVTQRPYPLSKFEEEFLREVLAVLLEQGIVRSSTSPWMSPVVLTRKPDGTLRLCIDYRRLNAVTELDPYPLPRIDQQLNKMSGCEYFSCIDVASAFWNVEICPEDIPKSGFCCVFGNFEWLRMPFGMVNNGATFQRLMDRIMPVVPYRFAYLEDCHVFSIMWQMHLDHLRDTLRRVHASQLKLKLSKCLLGACSVKCLGSVVDRSGRHTDPDKVGAIMRLPGPTNGTAVRSFLGMAGFYERHVRDFARLTAPLRLLTGKGSVFSWTAECQAAYDALKHALVSAPVLRLPDWDRPFILATDWSTKGLGAVLSQVDPDTEFEHPICFASRALTSAERNYGPTEGECLGIVWAVAKFRYYLHGRHFIARTDHKALEWLDTARFGNPKLERWALRLQEHSFSVEYIKGIDNVVADCLSRTFVGTLDVCAAWPEHASYQRVLDAVSCTSCGLSDGWDNMVICDGCDRCFHLRCLLPPQTCAPSGPWLCPACDPGFSSNVQELYNADTVLQYRPGTGRPAPQPAGACLFGGG